MGDAGLSETGGPAPDSPVLAGDFELLTLPNVVLFVWRFSERADRCCFGG